MIGIYFSGENVMKIKITITIILVLAAGILGNFDKIKRLRPQPEVQERTEVQKPSPSVSKMYSTEQDAEALQRTLESTGNENEKLRKEIIDLENRSAKLQTRLKALNLLR